MGLSAVWTVPCALFELQLSLQFLAGDSADMTGWKIGMHHDDSTVLGLFRFIGYEASECRPGCRVDVFSKLTIACHVRHLQALQTDHLVFVDQGAGEFVEVVDALGCDVLMALRYTDTGFSTVFGAFLFTGEGLLQSLESSLGFLVVSGIVDLSAVREGCEMSESQVDAGDIRAGGPWWCVFTGK